MSGRTTASSTTNHHRRSSIGINAKDDATRTKIERMEIQREERRRAMETRKKERAEEEKRNIAAGNPGDVDFIGMVRQWRQQHAHQAKPLTLSYQKNGGHPRICVCVRKRPINDKERTKNDHDSVTCLNPSVYVHSAKFKVDGITKYLDHNSFCFDYAFNETVSTEDVYVHSSSVLVNFVCRGSGERATVFAYGQTGSGKTHTMSGIQELLVDDLFHMLEHPDDNDDSIQCSIENTKVCISFFEIYGGGLQDLLNNRQRLRILEDGNHEIIVTGLQEVAVDDIASVRQILQAGNDARTTHSTEANDTSSRSHAICQIMLRDRRSDTLRGKLSLVDLAGSERYMDTKTHNSQRRTEGADINQSLLALKECIRALGKKGAHVNYRASKLTLILKDCFASEHTMTTMIVTVSPGSSAQDHTLNTLRYADRVKEQQRTKTPSLLSSNHFVYGLKNPQSGTSPKSITNDRVVMTGGGGGGNRTLRTQISPTNAEQQPKPTSSVTPKESNLIVQDEVESTNHQHHQVAADYVTEQPEHHNGDVSERSDKENFEYSQVKEAIHQQEEEVFSLHMSNINESANLLELEGQLLRSIQKKNASDDDTNDYAEHLQDILERKEEMITAFQEKLARLQASLQQKQQQQQRKAVMPLTSSSTADVASSILP